MPYVYALYVCLTRMPHTYNLYLCLRDMMAYMSALYVLPYMYRPAEDGKVCNSLFGDGDQPRSSSGAILKSQCPSVVATQSDHRADF